MVETDLLTAVFKSYKINAYCSSFKKIRNISIFDIKIEPGTKIKSIQKIGDEIALNLKAFGKPLIRSIPEKGIVQLEIPSALPERINFHSEYVKIKSSLLGTVPTYLGNAIDGKDVIFDFALNPHLLIAGSTGSGKSCLLHTIISNLINIQSQTIIIDTKNVEYGKYNKNKNICVAVDFASAKYAINFLLEKMENRYKLLNKNIEEYNKFTPIILLIDEFADLILQDDNKEIYKMLLKLVQKCRAAKIFCILATQRPSVDILNGAIKANFPARLALKTASATDSKIILGANGAELLTNNGDALISNYKYNMQRFQVAFSG